MSLPIEPRKAPACPYVNRPRPRIKTQITVVVAAVTLMSRFRRRFLSASRRKNPRLLDLTGIPPLNHVTYDSALLERHDPLAHHVHHLPVVGRNKHRGADAVDPVQELHDAHACVRVEVAGRLVGDEYRRLGDEGAGDADPLLLATRELTRIRALLAPEADELQDLGHPRADGPPLLARDLHRVGHVLGGGLVGKELEVLEHTAYVPAVLGHVPARDGRELRAVHADRPAGRLHLLENKTHHRRLAGTAGPDEKDKLPGFDAEVHVLQGHDVPAVDLGYVFEVDHGLSASGRHKGLP